MTQSRQTAACAEPWWLTTNSRARSGTASVYKQTTNHTLTYNLIGMVRRGQQLVMCG